MEEAEQGECAHQRTEHQKRELQRRLHPCNLSQGKARRSSMDERDQQDHGNLTGNGLTTKNRNDIHRHLSQTESATMGPDSSYLADPPLRNAGKLKQ